jgi:hypothetical protein
MTKTLSQRDAPVWDFGLLSFELVWDFEIRISNFARVRYTPCALGGLHVDGFRANRYLLT